MSADMDRQAGMQGTGVGFDDVSTLDRISAWCSGAQIHTSTFLA
jgi:hypothetical protein